MARKLSSIARNTVALCTATAVSLIALRAAAQAELRVSAPSTDVVNPFAAKQSTGERPAPANPVPTTDSGLPRRYQNPFAQRPSEPRFVTPRLQPGTLSRWHRVNPPHATPAHFGPLDKRQIRAINPEVENTAAADEATDDEWDLLGPLAVQQRRSTLFALPESEEAEPLNPEFPPDPSFYGTESLDQPSWLAPHETTAASRSENIGDFTPPSRAAAQPLQDPFEFSEAEVIISDETPTATAPKMTKAGPEIAKPLPLPPALSQDAEHWYADAEQAASAATKLSELAAVVHLCQRGLECQPPRELAHSLRILAAWACNRCGELESDNCREDEALKAFELAIAWDPNCWLALHNRAVSRAQQGNLEGALLDFNRTIELNPGLAIAFRNRGELLAATGRTEEAAADYTMALAQLPNDAELHAMHGHAMHRLGRFEEALANFSRSIELSPHHAEVFAHRGNVLAEVGDYPRAIADYREALAIDTGSVDAHRSLSWLLATCPDKRYRNSQLALASGKKAAELAAPGDPFVLDTLAAAYANVGQFQLAIRYQQEAIANVDGNFAELFTGRLALYEQGLPFRNGLDRAADGTSDVRAASLEMAAPAPR